MDEKIKDEVMAVFKHYRRAAILLISSAVFLGVVLGSLI